MDSAGAPRRGATRRDAARGALRASRVYICLRRRRRRRRRRRWHPKIPYYYIDYKDHAAMRRAKNKMHRRAGHS